VLFSFWTAVRAWGAGAERRSRTPLIRQLASGCSCSHRVLPEQVRVLPAPLTKGIERNPLLACRTLARRGHDFLCKVGPQPVHKRRRTSRNKRQTCALTLHCDRKDSANCDPNAPAQAHCSWMLDRARALYRLPWAGAAVSCGQHLHALGCVLDRLSVHAGNG